MVHKCLHNNEPKYLKDLLQLKTFTRNTRASTCRFTLIEPRTVKATFASRAFSVQGPVLWNKLPVSLREATDFKTFKRLLKTHIFKTVFKNWTLIYKFFKFYSFTCNFFLPSHCFYFMLCSIFITVFSVKRTRMFYFKYM